MKTYQTIIIGAGASGLYCGCKIQGSALILEKTAKVGTKLLMAGSGQCNVTHGGSVRDFLEHYGEKGKLLRSALKPHSNLELRDFLESLGVPTVEREDQKVFPKSMASRDLLDALLAELDRKEVKIAYGNEVTEVLQEQSQEGYQVITSKDSYKCKNLVVATGGCSYPSTGSDGSMFKVLARDLGLKIIEPRPALTSVFVKDYPYGELSGISFKDAGIRINGKHAGYGDLLLTQRNFSGPVVLNNARYMGEGDILSINYMGQIRANESSPLASQLKKDFAGNDKSPINYLSQELGLSKRFSRAMIERLGMKASKVSQLSGSQIEALTKALTGDEFIVERLGSFKEAMVTAGGAELSQINLRTMEVKTHPGLYIIGEALDVDGDTGGYNLQFAYSSAMVAAESIATQSQERAVKIRQ